MSTVLVTGCSSGFGLLAALEFARRGHDVVATMRNLAKADKLQAAAEADGLKVDLVALDVTSDESVQAAVTDVESRYGGIDIAVNNAGFASAGAIEAVPDEVVRQLFETNVFGVLRVLRAVLPGMRERGSGAIVNVGSAAGFLPGMPFDGYYYATKHTLEAITEALAYEVEPFGIRVAIVEPGLYKTDIAGNLVAAGTPGVVDVYADRQDRRLAMRLDDFEAQGGDPQEVADTIVEAATGPDRRLRWPLGPGIDALVAAMPSWSAADRDAWIRGRLPD